MCLTERICRHLYVSKNSMPSFQIFCATVAGLRELMEEYYHRSMHSQACKNTEVQPMHIYIRLETIFFHLTQ